MKTILLLGLLLLASCSPADPLDQTCTKDFSLDPLYDSEGKRAVDSLAMHWIVNAMATNKVKGISNEGKTYRELLQQGEALAVEEQTAQIRDSLSNQTEGGNK